MNKSENMKGLTLNILVVAITLLVVTAVGSLLLSQVSAADIGQYLTSTFTGCGRKNQNCCPKNWCVSGLTCSNGKCVEEIYEIVLDETYLINNPETANRSQREYFFQSKTGLGEQDCSNADHCNNCSKIFNFTNAKNCNNCDICDVNSDTCKSCLSCDSAENGKYQELYDCFNCNNCNNINKDNSMADKCPDCSFCSYANVSTFTNDLNCSYCYQCEPGVICTGVPKACNLFPTPGPPVGPPVPWACDGVQKGCSTPAVPGGLCTGSPDPCDGRTEAECGPSTGCTWSSTTGSVCISCAECGSEPYTVCDSCNRTDSTVCKAKSDYQLCEKVKDCIMNYRPDRCEIEELVPLPWNNTYSFGDTVFNILKNCINEDLLRHLPEGGQQKICKLDNRCKIMGDINGDGIIDMTDVNLCAAHFGQDWPDCDINEDGKVDMKDIALTAKYLGRACFEQQYFINDNPLYMPAATLKEMLESRSLTGETAGILFNDCGYSSAPSNLPTASVFEIYSSKPELFSSVTTPRTPEGDIPVNLKIVVSNVSLEEDSSNGCTYHVYLCAQEAIARNENDNILDFYRTFAYFNETVNITDTKKWERMYGSTQVNVTGTKYLETIVNLSGRTADAQQIAKSIIAGLRDYVSINSFINQTVGFFCLNNSLYSSMDECYNNSVTLVLNDKVPWKLESFVVPPDPLSNIPDYKYVYYDSTSPLYSFEVKVTLTLFAYTSNITSISNKIFISPVVILEPAGPVLPPFSITSFAANPQTSKSPFWCDFFVDVNGGTPPYKYSLDSGQGLALVERSQDSPTLNLIGLVRYNAPKEYTAKITVTDNNGLSDTKSITITAT